MTYGGRALDGTANAALVVVRRELHCYDYVRLPFERVRDALVNEGVDIFARATGAASEDARRLVSCLKLSINGFDLGKNIVIRVTRVRPPLSEPSCRAIRLDLVWQAEAHAQLFPTMHGSLLASAFADETRLDLRGAYDPPGGCFGDAADRLLGHRIAEACARRFLDAVACRLCEEAG